MDKLFQYLLTSQANHLCQKLAGLVCALALWATPAARIHRLRIAVIPQTDGTMQWEPVHAGVGGRELTRWTSIYWNAPTREDDVEAQIALVDRIVRQLSGFGAGSGSRTGA